MIVLLHLSLWAAASLWVYLTFSFVRTWWREMLDRQEEDERRARHASVKEDVAEWERSEKDREKSETQVP